MKLSDVIPLDQEIERARQTNVGFRKLWDESTFARDVGTKAVAYRAETTICLRQTLARCWA
jgi:hypothetical protein